MGILNKHLWSFLSMDYFFVGLGIWILWSVVVFVLWYDVCLLFLGFCPLVFQVNIFLLEKCYWVFVLLAVIIYCGKWWDKLAEIYSSFCMYFGMSFAISVFPSVATIEISDYQSFYIPAAWHIITKKLLSYIPIAFFFSST